MTKKQTLLILITLLILATIMGYWLVTKNNYTAIFKSLEKHQLNAVENYLSAKGIPFEIDDENSQILVSNEDKYRLRMDIISDGVINENRVGFEIFNNSDYGMTDFAQKVNFQRALQGELEKTISAIDGVRNVRVHLKLSTKKMLFTKQKPITASVVLYQKPGIKISPSRIRGIKNLVSGAVENLERDNVFVLDSSGKNIGDSLQNKNGHFQEQGSVRDKLENKLVEQASRILGAIYPKEAFKVSVSVDVDMTTRSMEIETIPNLKNGALIRKKKIVDEGQNKNRAVSDVINGSEEVEYLYGKQLERINYATGRTSRISVGVVIRNTEIADNADIEKVLWSSLGLNKERGDSIEVMLIKASPVVDIAKSSIPKAETVRVTSQYEHDSKYDYLYMTNLLFIFTTIFLIIRFIRLKNKSFPKLTHQEERVLMQDLREWIKNV